MMAGRIRQSTEPPVVCGLFVYERSIFGGTAVLFGDQRWKAALTVEHHCELVWHRVKSPPMLHK